MDRIRDHYIEYTIASTDLESVAAYREPLRPDGTWPDINYPCNRRSGWQPRKHVERIRMMACAYQKPGHPLEGDQGLRNDILRALKHYLTENYKCRSWWYNRIGVPKYMADALVLMGDDLPKEMRDWAIKQVVSLAKIRMTGQNRVWLAEITLTRCLIENDPEGLKKARDVILSQIRVTTREGVQPDWSYHQHGPQLKWGNYGASFAACALKWAIVLRGKDLAVTDEQLEVIRNYVMEGYSWAVWKGRMDLSACGKHGSLKRTESSASALTSHPSREDKF